MSDCKKTAIKNKGDMDPNQSRVTDRSLFLVNLVMLK